MRAVEGIRRRLGWKLFVSYLIVIAVGVLVLAGAVQLQTPSAIQRHVDRMESHLLSDPGLVEDLRQNFTEAVNEITLTAAMVALVVAVVVSVFTARRITNPIRTMMSASQNIAAGHFEQRVEVPSQDELGNLAKSFNQMAAELEQTEKRRLALIGDVAHELRTPLSNIRGIMEALMDGVLPAEPNSYASVQREVIRLQRLVQDLQELSQVEAGETYLDLSTVSPVALVNMVCERLRLQFEDKEVVLVVDVPENMPLVRADPARANQILLNLLGNALQYTEAGGQVTIRVQRQDSDVMFTISDTGIGVSPADVSRLFERFYRVDKSRSRATGGSGIGLTIAKHLVERQGGRIWMTSEGVAQGSVFAFTLSVAESQG